MEAVRGVTALQDELEKVKENLKGVDENIKKLYGRDPTENRPMRRVSHGDGDAVTVRGGPAGRLFGEARKIINNPNREAPPRSGRRVSLGGGPRVGIRARLGPKRGRDSDDEDEAPPKRSVQSSIVANPKEPIKREDSIAMKTDTKGIARNRRMFGALLGTLQRFQADSKKEEDKEKRRQDVERKLEEKQEEEKVQLRRERAALWGERRAKQRELRRLEQKMRLVKMFEDWEKETRKQANFIKTTRGKTHIFYKPKIMAPANEWQLKETERYIEGVIQERKKRLEQDIEKLMSQAHRDDNVKGEESGDYHEPVAEESGSDASDESDMEDGELKSSKHRADTGDYDNEKSDKNGMAVKVKVEPEEGVTDDDLEVSNKGGRGEPMEEDQQATTKRSEGKSKTNTKTGSSHSSLSSSGSDSGSSSDSGSESSSDSEAEGGEKPKGKLKRKGSFNHE